MRNITNQDVVDYLDKLYNPVNVELNDIRLDAESRNVPIIQRETERLLISLLEMNKPNRILEIGTAIGYSSMVFASICKDAQIVTIEKDDELYKEAISNIEKLDLKNEITVMQGDAKELKDVINKYNEKPEFDFIFIDAAKSHYMKFWNDIMEMVQKGAIVFCDNVLMRAMTVDKKYDTHDKHRTNIRRMTEFLDYITNLEQVDTTVLPVGDGVSISYIKE